MVLLRGDLIYGINDLREIHPDSREFTSDAYFATSEEWRRSAALILSGL